MTMNNEYKTSLVRGLAFGAAFAVGSLGVISALYTYSRWDSNRKAIAQAERHYENLQGIHDEQTDTYLLHITKNGRDFATISAIDHDQDGSIDERFIWEGRGRVVRQGNFPVTQGRVRWGAIKPEFEKQGHLNQEGFPELTQSEEEAYRIILEKGGFSE